MGDARKNTQYLEIVDWDRRISAELRKKTKPPFRWCKLIADDVDTLGDLTLREYGAYVRLLNLATLTDNRTVYRPGWIRRRSGVSRSAIESLLDRGLVRLSSASVQTGKPQQKHTPTSNNSGGIPENLQNSSGQGRGRDGDRILNGGERSAPRVKNSFGPAPLGIRPNGRQPEFRDLTAECQRAGVAGSNWTAITDVIEKAFGFTPNEKQLKTMERQLNDRSGK